MSVQPKQNLFKYIILFGLFLLQRELVFSQSSIVPEIPFQAEAEVSVDGKLDDWSKLKKLFVVDEFVSPWSSSDFGKTVFKAFYDKEYLYFYFDIEDKNIVEKKFEREEDVAKGDRGEIFLSADSSLSEYFCFEIAPSGEVLDYKAKYYRKFDYEWDLKGLEIKTDVGPSGYILEGRIPLEFVKGLIKSKSSSEFRMGIFRGEFNSLSWNEKDINWISWIRPNTEKPDFHTPSAFQWVRLGRVE
ncbi:carbohydrate-binding family 9-like protein [Sphingobacterium sp. WM]|uniref:carbohydrate-binding family 9-like protein n=1 Tax=Sphingobacterium sp. WM TaxID=3031802 RepID=UPI00240DBD89|nr:carbohydrate-binding family 9-like protein [Sphingobacterium sp. WM]WFB65246.1 carbohydrate-binding family 9-like protein [Sphingobacterium sp. WM]